MTFKRKIPRIPELSLRDVTSIILCIIAIVLFFIFIPKDKISIINYHDFISLLIVINNILVGINNFLFIREMMNINRSGDFEFLNEKHRKEDKIYTNIFIAFNIFSLAISLYIIIIFSPVILSFFHFNEKSVPIIEWDELYDISESLNLLMFIFFIIADASMLKAFKNSINSLILKINKGKEQIDVIEADIKSLEQESPIKKHLEQTLHDQTKTQSTTEEALTELVTGRKLTFNALWLIDVVGFIGILGILLISKESILRQCAVGSTHLDFIEGFTAGAITLHVFITQLILATLKPLIVVGDKKSQDSFNYIVDFS